MTPIKLSFSRLIIAFNLLLPVTFFVFATPTGVARHEASPSLKLDRAQMMVFNLNRGPESAGFYLLKSLKETQSMARSLDKAARQVEQADAFFAKSRGRADDRFLSSSQQQLTKAQKTAEQLHNELAACYDDLKTSIKQTLVREN
jgi:hypothetical protein